MFHISPFSFSPVALARSLARSFARANRDSRLQPRLFNLTSRPLTRPLASISLIVKETPSVGGESESRLPGKGDDDDDDDESTEFLVLPGSRDSGSSSHR